MAASCGTQRSDAQSNVGGGSGAGGGFAGVGLGGAAKAAGGNATAAGTVSAGGVSAPQGGATVASRGGGQSAVSGATNTGAGGRAATTGGVGGRSGGAMGGALPDGAGGALPGGAGGALPGGAGANAAGAAGSAGSAGEGVFSFFAFGDAHAGQSASTDATLRTAMAQMKALDPNAAFGISNGDLVEDSTAAAWMSHDAAVMNGVLHPEATSIGPLARYLAVVDNHDLGFPVERTDWLSNWNQHLPGQLTLGHNGKDGIYYSFRYRNAFFIVLDSIHPSAAQDAWLLGALASAEATSAAVRIAFFHQPVYMCTRAHPPLAAGLPWVDAFEKNAVKLVFVSHSHIYERTCPVLKGRCASASAGVVYQGVGPLAANNFRALDVDEATVSGKDSEGNARSDDYACSGSQSILVNSKTNVNDFCRVRIDGCRVLGECYLVKAGNMMPFDTWEVNGCK